MWCPPYGTHSMNSWSSQLATVLVEACSLIESIFHQYKDNAATAQNKGKPKDRLTLGPCTELYGDFLRLSERTAILLTDVPALRTPFGLWTNILGEACFDKDKHVPGWWNL